MRPIKSSGILATNKRVIMMKKPYFLLPLVYAISVAANIREIAKGSAASWVGTCFTVAFLLAWIVLLILLSTKKFNHIMLGYWAVTCIIAIVVWIGNLYDFSTEFLIPGIVLFVTPLYGISITGISTNTTVVAIIFISLLFIVCCLLRRNQAQKEK